MAAKKGSRAKASKVTRAKATKKSSVRKGRKAPGLPLTPAARGSHGEIASF
jgi:hypothetical protein